MIVGAVSASELERLIARAAELQLDVLVEVHDREELSIAIGAGAAIVGVNNRNLRTLAVDLNVSAELIARIPRGVVAVSESGLRSPADIGRFTALGYRAFLIGERFMATADPGAALQMFLEDYAGQDLRHHA